MDSRRRTIEVDEDVAVALEKRAAEEDMSVSDMLAADYLDGQPLQIRHVEIPPEEREELDALWEEWQADRMGVPAEEVAEWMKSWGTANELPPPRPRRL